jgi:hypothetical protein
MRVFLSFHSRDKDAADRIRAALAAERPHWDLFYSPSIVGGAFWMPKLGEAITRADGFIFIIGHVPGDYQALEYYEAFDRKIKEDQLPLVPLLLDQSSPPGWSFFKQLHWLDGSDPAGRETIAAVIRSIESGGAKGPPKDLWRLVNPYRGDVHLDKA